MTQTAPAVATPLGLLRLNPHQAVRVAIGPTLSLLQHKANLRAGYPVVTDLYEFDRPRMNPIAVVGGGPSLADTLPELLAFQDMRGPVMAAGSAHDHLARMGVRLNYCAVLDPDPVMANYLREDAGDCLYLVASHVAPHVFWALEGRRVAVFGAGGTFEKEHFAPVPIVNAGGRTVGTRAMGLAIALGFRELHLFGVDSCFGPDEATHHAYTVNEAVAAPHAVYCGGRKFMCAPYMVGQATDFQKFMGFFSEEVAVEVHGDSLTAQIMKESDRMAAAMAA
jgi:uncharacterized Rossmann fold enzyme